MTTQAAAIFKVEFYMAPFKADGFDPNPLEVEESIARYTRAGGVPSGDLFFPGEFETESFEGVMDSGHWVPNRVAIFERLNEWLAKYGAWYAEANGVADPKFTSGESYQGAYCYRDNIDKWDRMQIRIMKNDGADPWVVNGGTEEQPVPFNMVAVMRISTPLVQPS